MWGKFAKAVLRGEYKLSPWSIVAAIGTILYTISPIDLIPELFVGPLGYIDDLGLWGVLLVILRWELGRFEKSVAATSVTISGTATRDAN
jgi:uncharacterized membrane protein YkvA (DUF1232 family)